MQADDGRAVAMSHQGTITLGLTTLLQNEARMLDYQASNCGVMLLEFEPSPVLKVSNYTEHLTMGRLETDIWAL